MRRLIKSRGGKLRHRGKFPRSLSVTVFELSCRTKRQYNGLGEKHKDITSNNEREGDKDLFVADYLYISRINVIILIITRI